MNLKLDTKKVTAQEASIKDSSSMRSSFPNQKVRSDDAIDGLNFMIPKNITTYSEQVEMRK